MRSLEKEAYQKLAFPEMIVNNKRKVICLFPFHCHLINFFQLSKALNLEINKGQLKKRSSKVENESSSLCFSQTLIRASVGEA